MPYCFTGITKVTSADNPNQGRDKWNSNFESLAEAVCFSLTGSTTGNTIVQSGDNNINVQGAISVPPIYTISLNESISASSISADTYYIGNQPFTAVTSGMTYTNSDPTPVSIGGIPAGSTFSNQTMEQMWNALLYPYQAPAFTSFGRTNLQNTYEVGQNIDIGSQTFSWNISNSSNVSADTVTIIQNISPTTTLYGPGPNSSPQTISVTATFSASTPSSVTLYTISAINTNGNSLSTSISANWRHKIYWGTHPSFSLPNNTEILNADGAGIAPGNEFSTSRNQTRDGIDGNGDYLFFAWPTSFGNPTFVINGLPSSAWTKIGDEISFTNSQGFVHTYDVWISDTAQNSPITTFTIN